MRVLRGESIGMDVARSFAEALLPEETKKKKKTERSAFKYGIRFNSDGASGCWSAKREGQEKAVKGKKRTLDDEEGSEDDDKELELEIEKENTPKKRRVTRPRTRKTRNAR